jgi:hypothetical protein
MAMEAVAEQDIMAAAAAVQEAVEAEAATQTQVARVWFIPRDTKAETDMLLSIIEIYCLVKVTDSL